MIFRRIAGVVLVLLVALGAGAAPAGADTT
jgi:hypothetical protein